MSDDDKDEKGSNVIHKGKLPKLQRPGFEDWFGVDHVGIQHGQVHVWTHKVTKSPWRLAFAVGDRTGAAQCFSHKARYIPPEGSGWPEVVGDGTNSGCEFISKPGKPIPTGVWRVRIKNKSPIACAAVYQIASHN